MAPVTILCIDDEPNILSSLRRALELEGLTVVVAGSGALGLERLGEREVDVVLLDVMMPGMDGLQTLAEIRKRHPEIPVIMMSGNASVGVAVAATKLGAHDFLEKPLGTEKTVLAIKNALSFEELRREHARLAGRARGEFAMVGTSARLRAIFEQIRVTAPSNGRVLITGENGTGKELVARALHEHSRRSGRAFIKLNCAAIPTELMESELFGHEKGAFTGALSMRRGKFELADGGTLFLDEVGDMSLAAQAKVLRVLQEGEFERVGGAETLRVDVRVVAATNKDLAAELAAGRFREDLYYRLAVVPVEIPPLRERRDDIPALALHFLELTAAANDRRVKRLADGGLALLLAHDWPGNVRELRNVVERLVILTGDATEIGEADVAALFPRARPARGAHARGVSLKDQVLVAEREIVVQALEANGGQVAATARELGLERSHLYKKMRALGITPRADEDE